MRGDRKGESNDNLRFQTGDGHQTSLASLSGAVGGGDAECDDMAVDNGVHVLLVKAWQHPRMANRYGCVQIKVTDPGPC